MQKQQYTPITRITDLLAPFSLQVSTANIKNILPELFSENLMRGRGLFCQSLMKAQMASPSFTPVYAALVAVVNTKFPELGELLLHRVIAQFKRAYKRNDKPVCVGCAKFLAHLINQGVVHEVREGGEEGRRGAGRQVGWGGGHEGGRA